MSGGKGESAINGSIIIARNSRSIGRGIIDGNCPCASCIQRDGKGQIFSTTIAFGNTDIVNADRRNGRTLDFKGSNINRTASNAIKTGSSLVKRDLFSCIVITIHVIGIGRDKGIITGIDSTTAGN